MKKGYLAAAALIGMSFFLASCVTTQTQVEEKAPEVKIEVVPYDAPAVETAEPVTEPVEIEIIEGAVEEEEITEAAPAEEIVEAVPEPAEAETIEEAIEPLGVEIPEEEVVW